MKTDDHWMWFINRQHHNHPAIIDYIAHRFQATQQKYCLEKIKTDFIKNNLLNNQIKLLQKMA